MNQDKISIEVTKEELVQITEALLFTSCPVLCFDHGDTPNVWENMASLANKFLNTNLKEVQELPHVYFYEDAFCDQNADECCSCDGQAAIEELKQVGNGKIKTVSFSDLCKQ